MSSIEVCCSSVLISTSSSLLPILLYSYSIKVFQEHLGYNGHEGNCTQSLKHETSWNKNLVTYEVNKRSQLICLDVSTKVLIYPSYAATRLYMPAARKQVRTSIEHSLKNEGPRTAYFFLVIIHHGPLSSPFKPRNNPIGQISLNIIC